MFRFVILAVACAGAPLCAQVEPDAGKWKTWVIGSAADYRVAPPVSQDITQELSEVQDWISQRTPAVMTRIAFWDAGPPAYRWIQTAANEVASHNLAGPYGTRAMALVAAAVNDATIAAWDSKYAYMRQRPSEVDPMLATAVAPPGSPSYPSDYAAVAGAAASVLSYLFPDHSDTFDAMANEAAQSRLLAGVEFPSDSTEGMKLGHRIGAVAVTYAQADGSDTVFTGSFPPAPGKWSNPNPVAPLAGTWKPWALTSGSQVRLAAPPAFDSAEMAAQLQQVQQQMRTTDQTRTAWVWQPSFINPWLDTIAQKLFEHHLDRDPPRAAEAYASAMIAQHDATIACWDTKYTYLEMRPVMFDATISTLFATPAHPSFPSGHACASGAVAQVLDIVFPDESAAFDAQASAAGLSTFYAGIHFPNDVDAGLKLGRAAAQVVLAAQTR
jgi:membrane-associated phospholipid phosphatase